MVYGRILLNYLLGLSSNKIFHDIKTHALGFGVLYIVNVLSFIKFIYGIICIPKSFFILLFLQQLETRLKLIYLRENPMARNHHRTIHSLLCYPV